MLPDEKLADLRRLAEAATPGPWSIVGLDDLKERGIDDLMIVSDGFFVDGRPCWVTNIGWSPGPNESEPDARYIAALSPDVVLALIDEIERLRAAIDRRPDISAEDASTVLTKPVTRAEGEAWFHADRRVSAALQAHAAKVKAFGHISKADECQAERDADVCGKRCDHGSECLRLRGHDGGHETQHGCIFYDAAKVNP